MKRVAAVLLIFILLFVFMSVTVFAETAMTEDELSSTKTDLSVIFKIEQKLSENEVSYIIIFPEKSEIAALQLEVSYDATILRYQSKNVYPLYESGIGQINDVENGKITCAFISLMPLEEGGKFIEFSFTCLEKTPFTSKTISFNFTELANSTGKNIEHNVRYIGFPELSTDQKEGDTLESQPAQSETNGIIESKPNEEVDDNYDILDEGANVSDDVGNDEIITDTDSSTPKESGNDSPRKEQTETIIFNEETQQKEPPAKEESIRDLDVEVKKHKDQKHFLIVWIALSVFLILSVFVVTFYIIKRTKERKK